MSWIFSILLFSAFQCDSEDQKEYIEVQLEIPFKIDPPDESVILEDTLWITIDTPDTLRDYLSNRYYKLPNCEFPISLMVLKLIDPESPEGSQPGAIDKFTIHPTVGAVQNIGSLSGELIIVYGVTSQKYRLKIGMVPKEKGIFSFIILLRHELGGPSLPIIDDRPLTNGKRRIYYANRFNFLLNDGNFHFDLYKANVKEDPSIESEPDFKKLFKVYTFEVK